jgi:hypothetical protein
VTGYDGFVITRCLFLLLTRYTGSKGEELGRLLGAALLGKIELLLPKVR